MNILDSNTLIFVLKQAILDPQKYRKVEMIVELL